MATMVRRILRPQLSQPRRRRKHDPAPLIERYGDDSFYCGGGGACCCATMMMMMMMIVVGWPLGSSGDSIHKILDMKMVVTALAFPLSTTTTHTPPQPNHHRHHHCHLFRTPDTDSTISHHHHHENTTTKSRRSKLGMILSIFLKRVVSTMTSFRTQSNDHSITATTNVMDSSTRTMPLSFTRPPPPPPLFSSSSSLEIHPPSSTTSITASRQPISNEDKQKFCQAVWQGQSQHVYIPSLVARPSDRITQTALPGASPPPVTDFTTRAHPVGRPETTTKTDQEMDWSNRRAIHLVQERLIQMTSATAATTNHRLQNNNINQVTTTIRPSSPARTSRSAAPLSPAPRVTAGNVHSHQQPSTVSAIPRKRRGEEEANGSSRNDPTESSVSAPIVAVTQTMSTPPKKIRMEIPTTRLEERLDSSGESNTDNATIERTRTTTAGENDSNHHPPKEQESKIDRAKKWGIDMSKFT